MNKQRKVEFEKQVKDQIRKDFRKHKEITDPKALFTTAFLCGASFAFGNMMDDSK